MASSRVPALLPVSLVAILFCLLVFLPGQSEARTCVFKCMRSVIACKRKVAVTPGGADACCDKYFECFLGCKPDAEKLPPCSGGTGKRAMWGKRDGGEMRDLGPLFDEFF